MAVATVSKWKKKQRRAEQNMGTYQEQSHPVSLNELKRRQRGIRLGEDSAC